MMLFLDLFATFFKIGLFGFGGGYGMLSLIQTETVVHHTWLTTAEFTNIVAISQMTPGPIGINSATYCGYQAVHNAGYGNLVATLGSATTTLALILPSFLLMVLVCRLLFKYMDTPHVHVGRQQQLVAQQLSRVDYLGYGVAPLAEADVLVLGAHVVDGEEAAASHRVDVAVHVDRAHARERPPEVESIERGYDVHAYQALAQAVVAHEQQPRAAVIAQPLHYVVVALHPRRLALQVAALGQPAAQHLAPPGYAEASYHGPALAVVAHAAQYAVNAFHTSAHLQSTEYSRW